MYHFSTISHLTYSSSFRDWVVLGGEEMVKLFCGKGEVFVFHLLSPVDTVPRWAPGRIMASNGMNGAEQL